MGFALATSQHVDFSKKDLASLFGTSFFSIFIK